MTTYYISRDGSNAFNGLGPDASHGTNKPWLTVGKSMNTGSPVLPGDTVYIAPGYYWDEALVPIATIGSSGSPSQWIGDPTNAQGFKDGSGVRRAPGIPWVTTRTSGYLDGSISTTNMILNMNTNAPVGLQFKFLLFEARSDSTRTIYADPGAGTDWLFEDCVFGVPILLGFTAGTPTAGRNITFRRCVMLGDGKDVIACGTTLAAATADADMNIVFEDNFFLGSILCQNLKLGSVAGNKAGGIIFRNNTFLYTAWPYLSTTASQVSTVTPIRLKGNLFGSYTTLTAGTTGQVIDDGYNRGLSWLSGTNVTIAGTSKQHVAFNVVLPHLVTWGLEMPRADFLGWTDAAATAQKFSASGATTADFRGRTVRPWGSGASIGCWQAQEVAQDATSAITGGGTNSLKITGAGEVSLYIPVDATGFTVSVTTKSTSYGGASYPQLIVVANPSIGVTSDTTDTAAAATEETLTTATITPTAKGVMEVRLVSRSTSTTSVTYFDLLSRA